MMWTIESRWVEATGGMREVWRIVGPAPFGGLEGDGDRMAEVAGKLNAMATGGGVPLVGLVNSIGGPGEHEFDMEPPEPGCTYVVLEMPAEDARQLEVSSALAIRSMGLAGQEFGGAK